MLVVLGATTACDRSSPRSTIVTVAEGRGRVDLGKVQSELWVPFELQLEHPGGGALRDVRTHASCGCIVTSPRVASEWAPGEPIVISGSFQVPDRLGLFTRSIAVLGCRDDGRTTTVRGEIRGDACEWISIQPLRGEVEVPRGERPVPVVFRWQSSDGKTVRPAIVADSLPVGVQVVGHTIREGQSGEISMQFDSPLLVEQMDLGFDVDWAGDIVGRMRFHVTLRTRRRWQSRPMAALVGEADGVATMIDLIPQDVEPIVLEPTVSAPPGVRATLRSGDARCGRRVELELVDRAAAGAVAVRDRVVLVAFQDGEVVRIPVLLRAATAAKPR
ncbi:MAG: hypothetical protein ACKV2T_43405 [Kofleriaceae bacterium]